MHRWECRESEIAGVPCILFLPVRVRRLRTWARVALWVAGMALWVWLFSALAGGAPCACPYE